jgi:hypothetical protein
MVTGCVLVTASDLPDTLAPCLPGSWAPLFPAPWFDACPPIQRLHIPLIPLIPGVHSPC